MLFLDFHIILNITTNRWYIKKDNVIYINFMTSEAAKLKVLDLVDEKIKQNYLYNERLETLISG